jgi:hypothetical protein
MGAARSTTEGQFTADVVRRQITCQTESSEADQRDRGGGGTGGGGENGSEERRRVSFVECSKGNREQEAHMRWQEIGPRSVNDRGTKSTDAIEPTCTLAALDVGDAADGSNVTLTHRIRGGNVRSNGAASGEGCCGRAEVCLPWLDGPTSAGLVSATLVSLRRPAGRASTSRFTCNFPFGASPTAASN